MKNKKIKVSACIITYNHEEFLRDCLDAAVNQELDFDYEIIVGEDKSTDRTLEICREYAQRYPNLIEVIERPENLGMVGNWLETLKKCSGDYIALCEGDDFWTNPMKLKKQVEFLEQNEEYVLCGSKTQSLDEAGNRSESGGKIYEEITLEQVLKRNQFTTCTAVFRKKSLIIPPFKNFTKFFTVDWPLWCSLLKDGKGYNFEEITAQYNIHSAGASSGRSRVNTLKNKLEDRMLMMENFPDKKRIIKNYGLKIILHYIYQSGRLKINHFKAMQKNFNLIYCYLLS